MSKEILSDYDTECMDVMGPDASVKVNRITLPPREGINNENFAANFAKTETREDHKKKR